MSAETAEEKMRRVLADLVSGDQDKLKELCHPDLTIEQAQALPWGGIYKGVAGKNEMSKRLRGSLTEIDVSIESILSDASGDHFVMVNHLRARSSQTGRPVDMTVAEFFSFRDGRLISIRPHYFDTKAIADACYDS